MRDLEKIVTRFYYPITVQAWFKGATRELRKAIGVGFSDVIFKFDGEKLEVFRIAKELHTTLKDAMLKHAKTKDFLDGVNNYRTLVAKYDKALAAKGGILEAVQYAEKLYPLFAVSYFVSNLWIDEIEENKEKIVKLCKKYRELSDGFLIKLDQFVVNYLKQQQLSPFITLEVLDKPKNATKKIEWMKNGYIFSKGKFLNISWGKFLKKNGFLYTEEALPTTTDIIQGNTAFLGFARGAAKIIFSPLDFKKIEEGDILISPMTQPTFTLILSKIAAIVTDEGGITCHAAIVSRELGIPCVIGTEIATKVLRDGDMVEVDATHGKVTIIKKG